MGFCLPCSCHLLIGTEEEVTELTGLLEEALERKKDVSVKRNAVKEKERVKENLGLKYRMAGFDRAQRPASPNIAPEAAPDLQFGPPREAEASSKTGDVKKEPSNRRLQSRSRVELIAEDMRQDSKTLMSMLQNLVTNMAQHPDPPAPQLARSTAGPSTPVSQPPAPAQATAPPVPAGDMDAIFEERVQQEVNRRLQALLARASHRPEL